MPRREYIGSCVFFAVAFAVPWLGWAVLDDAALNLWLFPCFASLAGFAAAWAEGGRDGLRAFCRRTLRLRGTLGWIALAAAIPATLGLIYLFGSGVPASALRPAFDLGLATTLTAAIVTGPLAEEFGWRGYLQHTLLQRSAPLTATVLIAALWSLWHLPLFGEAVFGSLETSLRFFGYLCVWSAFMAYLVQRAGGSVWPAVALHWAANTHANLLGALFPGVDGSRLPGGSKGIVLYLILAAAFVAVHWRFFARREPRSGAHAADAAPTPASVPAER